MNCHGASYLHPLKSEIIYFHKVIGQVLLFALSTYCPVIQRCLYPLTSVYPSVLRVCNSSPGEAETGTSVGLANCQPSLRELQAGERNDG